LGYLKSVTVDLTVADKIRKDEPPESIKHAALEHFERYAKCINIFTDGSKSDTGLVGSAFYVKDLNDTVIDSVTT